MTYYYAMESYRVRRAPHGARGLKLHVSEGSTEAKRVAPRMGRVD